MKTLKKTLCLVLAVVMAVGVLILPANAAGYDDMTDTDKINPNYAVAVETLTGMGIISGKASGDTTKFDPNGTLLRQEAAIMIVNVMMTAGQKATELAGYADKFTDIAGTDVYARKEINYLAAKGIVSGKGDGLFKPHDTLTTYELLTMLRKVAEIKNGYVTEVNEWTAQAMKFADDYDAFAKDDLKASLFADPNKTPTREEAAQLIFSVITTNTDTSVTGSYIVTVYDLGPDVDDDGNPVKHLKNKYPGVTLEQALMLKVTYSDTTKYLVTVDADSIGGSSIGYQVYKLVKNTLRDPYGRPFTAYYNDKTNKDNVIYSDTALSHVDYTDKVVTLDKIFNDDFEVDYDGDSISVNVYEDGELTKTVTMNEDDTRATNADAFANFGGRGIEIEVYSRGDGVYDVIVINTYVAQLGKVAKDGNIYIAGAATTDNPADDIAVSGDDFAKGDIVLYTKGVYQYGAKKDYVASDVRLATPVEGYVSNKSNSASDKYFRLNGENTKYYLAENQNAVTWNGIKVMKSTDDPRHFWVDERNNVYHDYPDSVAAPETAPNYIYVIQYDQFENRADDGLYENSNVTAAAGARIKYLDLASGKVDTGDLALAHGKVDTTGWYIVGHEDEAAYKVGNHADRDDIAELVEGTFFGVEPNSKGQLVLTDVDEDNGDVQLQGNNFSAQKGLATVHTFMRGYVGGNGVVFTSDAYANSSTNLVMIKESGTGYNKTYAVSTLKGYKNFVNVNEGDDHYVSSTALVVASRDDPTIAANIYVIYSEEVEVTTVGTCGIYLGAGEESSDGFTYNFLVDGAVVTYSSKKGVAILNANAAVNPINKVYELTFTAGDLTGAAVYADRTRIAPITASAVLIDETTIILGRDQYALTADTVIYDATGDEVSLETTVADILGALTAATPADITVTAYCLSNATGAEKTITLIVVLPNA